MPQSLPDDLYAYTDIELIGTPYYGWGEASGGKAIFYTLTDTPVQGNTLYVGSGSFYPTYTDDPTDLRYGSFTETNPVNYVYQTDGSTYIKDNSAENTYTRYSAADVIIPDATQTVYTDTTALEVGLPLYDNTGTALIKEVGTVLTPLSFLARYITGSVLFEQFTPGTYVISLNAGSYDFILSAGGGGGAAAIRQNNEAGACGGTGAYGSFSLTLAASDTFTITVGAGGTGSAILSGGTAPSTGGSSTVITGVNSGTIVTLNGGGPGYAHATSNGDTASVGSGGTYTTTLSIHNLNNGKSGSRATTASNTQTGGTTINPSPYSSYGYGGGFSYTSGTSNISAANGGPGYIRIQIA